MNGINPALAVGQIWKDKGLRPTIVLEHAGQWEQLSQKVRNDNFWVEISDLNADGTIKNHSEYGTSDIDLVQFLGYAPGYGPSAIEHKAVSVEEPVFKPGDKIELHSSRLPELRHLLPVRGTVIEDRGDMVSWIGDDPKFNAHLKPNSRNWLSCKSQIILADSAPTDAELHARDGLTATDRRLLNERMDRQRKECDAAHKKFDDLGMLILIEQSANKDQFLDHEDHGDYIRLTGCTK